MTELTKPVSRLTKKTDRGRPIIVTIAPAGSQDDALIGLRRKGTRVTYTALVSDVYRMAALNYGRKQMLAKREARKNGVPWRVAKKAFDRASRI